MCVVCGRAGGRKRCRREHGRTLRSHRVGKQGKAAASCEVSVCDKRGRGTAVTTPGGAESQIQRQAKWVYTAERHDRRQEVQGQPGTRMRGCEWQGDNTENRGTTCRGVSTTKSEGQTRKRERVQARSLGTRHGGHGRQLIQTLDEGALAGAWSRRRMQREAGEGPVQSRTGLVGVVQDDSAGGEGRKATKEKETPEKHQLKGGQSKERAPVERRSCWTAQLMELEVRFHRTM